ncbi:MAG: DUF4136 domain-containing protein [Calditrichia bacterium]|nr:DUF4136 domain-containing protein [Calditrichia bacterium]
MDFSQFKSFKIYDGETVPGDELMKHPLIKKRVVSSVIKEMEAKGYTSADNADMVLVIHAGVKDRMQVTNWGGYGWYDPWWGPYGGRVDVNEYEESTLVIDIVDSQENDLVWRGLGTKVVENYSNQDKMQKMIDNYVAQILVKFPPTAKK